ncbi:MAG: hypothetical protein P8016_16435 [Sedimentisphaerales bacterium]
MTGKEFINSIANGKSDIIQLLLDILSKTHSQYCIIGGLAVNAYTEPVVSLDLDIVVAAENVKDIGDAAINSNLRVEKFEHSINLASDESDLRIQLQTDSRYQKFLSNAQDKEVLGYKMKVARVEDVLRGKVWAYMDKEQRKSKRQKDLAEIFRIIEKYPHLKSSLPESIQQELEK